MKRIAEDEKRGIEFSSDKTTSKKYPLLELTIYTLRDGVTTIGEWAFDGCPCEKSVKKQFPKCRIRDFRAG